MSRGLPLKSARHIVMPAVTAMLAFLPLTQSFAQQPDVQPAANPPAVFRLRLVDGRNGATVPNARIILWYDEREGPGYSLTSASDGTTPLPQPIGLPLRIFAVPADDFDCRKLSATQQPPAYNLKTIAARGFTADNNCGRTRVSTSPGELVLFIRPARWFEKINRNSNEQ